jgi:O-acetyl-ADP-ribose deacetylase (regulator of RNase III)
MIVYKDGDLLKDKSVALVNPVNCVGVMGAGVAEKFKQRFPENFFAYAKACREKTLKPGGLLVCNRQNFLKRDPADGPLYIINCATKLHWREPSRQAWVEKGLLNLRKFIDTAGIKSLAMPALGCGLGGLEWRHVELLVRTHFGDITDREVVVYKPH